MTLTVEELRLLDEVLNRFGEEIAYQLEEQRGHIIDAIEQWESDAEAIQKALAIVYRELDALPRYTLTLMHNGEIRTFDTLFFTKDAALEVAKRQTGMVELVYLNNWQIGLEREFSPLAYIEEVKNDN